MLDGRPVLPTTQTCCGEKSYSSCQGRLLDPLEGVATAASRASWRSPRFLTAESVGKVVVAGLIDPGGVGELL